MQIAIVYDSSWGHTAKQAQSVAAGVRRVTDADARLIAVSEGPVPWNALEASDAIAFGSPTCNGAPSARFKQFCEDSTKPAWTRRPTLASASQRPCAASARPGPSRIQFPHPGVSP